MANLVIECVCLASMFFTSFSWDKTFISIVTVLTLIKAASLYITANSQINKRFENSMLAVRQKSFSFQGEMKEDEKFKSVLLDNYPMGLLVCQVSAGDNLKIIFFNKLLKKMTEDEGEEDVINILPKFKSNEKNENLILKKTNLFKDLLSGSQNEKEEIKRYNYGMYEYLIYSSHVQINYNNKEETFIFLTFQDLHNERKFLMTNLYQNIKSQFLLTISHELNNPLNGLIHYGSKLVDSSRSPKKQKFITKLKMFKLSIKFFICNLSLYSKMVLRDKLNFHQEKFNMFSLLSSIAKKFENFYESKKIKSSLDISSAKNIVVFFDYEYLKLFLKNIFMLVCYKLENNKNFKIEARVSKENKTIKLEFIEQNSNKTIYKYLSKKEDESFNEDMPLESTVNTRAMLEELIENLSKLLKIKFTFRKKEQTFMTAEFGYMAVESESSQEREDEAELNEFSPSSKSINRININKIKRCIQLEQIFEGPFEKSKIQEIGDGPNAPNLIKPRVKMSHPHLTMFSKSLKDIDEGGINKLKSLFTNKEPSSRETKINIDSTNINIPSNDTLNKIQRRDSLNPSRNRSNYQLEITKLDEIVPQKNERDKTIKLGDDEWNKLLLNKPKFRKSSKSVVNIKHNYVSLNINLKPQEGNRLPLNPSQGKHLRTPLVTTISRKSLSSVLKPNMKLKGLSPYVCTTPLQKKKILVARKKDKYLSFNELCFSALNSLGPTVNSNIKCDCRRVLCVDDEKFNLGTMKNILKAYKIIPDVCYNGQEAVEKVLKSLDKTCCRSHYKLIFMDVMMPVMDGIEASKKIAKLCVDNNLEDLAIVVISAHDSDIIQQMVKGIDVVKEFVCKPVKKSKIDSLLNQFYFTLD